MNNAEDVIAILRRAFNGGPLRRIPKKRADADVLLALSLAELDPEGIFDESDINLHLSAWLAEISAEGSNADYATVRRLLVDYGFLRRASDGLVYRIRGEKVNELLTDEAKLIDPKQVFAEVSLERAARRNSFRS